MRRIVICLIALLGLAVAVPAQVGLPTVPPRLETFPLFDDEGGNADVDDPAI